MKLYRLRIPPDLVAFLRHLHPGIRTRLRHALEVIEEDPFLGKPLRNPLDGLFSYRVSAYLPVLPNHHLQSQRQGYPD